MKIIEPVNNPSAKEHPVSKNIPNAETLKIFKENDQNGKKDLEKITSNSPFGG